MRWVVLLLLILPAVFANSVDDFTEFDVNPRQASLNEEVTVSVSWSGDGGILRLLANGDVFDTLDCQSLPCDLSEVYTISEDTVFSSLIAIIGVQTFTLPAGRQTGTGMK